MAHFAQIDLNNIVKNVIVISNEMLHNSEGIEVEQIGIDFCKSLYGENTDWVQASYNDNIRKQYPSIDFIYDQTNDVFLSPKPFDSWILNSNFNWQAPNLTQAETKPMTGMKKHCRGIYLHPTPLILLGLGTKQNGCGRLQLPIQKTNNLMNGMKKT